MFQTCFYIQNPILTNLYFNQKCTKTTIYELTQTIWTSNIKNLSTTMFSNTLLIVIIIQLTLNSIYVNL